MEFFHISKQQSAHKKESITGCSIQHNVGKNCVECTQKMGEKADYKNSQDTQKTDITRRNITSLYCHG